MKIWINWGKENFREPDDNDLPKDFGDDDFMAKHYYEYSSLPEMPNAHGRGDCPTSGMIVYECQPEHREALPAWVVDLRYGDGEMLCFNAAWELWQWLATVMPVIKHVKRWNDLDG